MLEKINNSILPFLYGVYFCGLAVYLFFKAENHLKKKKEAILPLPIPPQQQGIILKAILTSEMQKKGPIPDVPAIKWTADALSMFIAENGMNPAAPIKVSRDLRTKDLIFEQDVRYTIPGQFVMEKRI